MKKALALILSLAMVLCLIPAVASADTGTLMATAPADGDKVVIFTPAYNKALGAFETAASFYNEGVDITPVDGAIADVAANIVWDVTLNDDGSYCFSQNGDKLSMDVEYSSTPKNKVNDKWTLTAVDGGYYIENVGRLNSAGDTHYKLEWYESKNYYSGYHTVAAGTEGMFTFAFYKVEEGEATPPPTGGEIDPPPAGLNTEDLVVLYSNDVHCGIGNEVKDAEKNVIGYTGGYAAVAAIKKGLEAEYENVLLVDAGDHVQGGPIGTLSTGSYIVDIMNFVGYDLSAVGNHEFDYGMDRFFELKELANYDYISANFMEIATGESVLDAYKVYTYGDKKVAFVGISTPETLTKSTPTYFQNAAGEWIYDFANTTVDTFVTAVQNAITAAADEADYVIALGHLGVDEASTPWTSTELIAKVSGLSAFIDGHSHSTVASELVKDKDDKDVTLTQTGTKLANLGKMILKADGTVTCELLPLADVTVDEATEDKLLEIYALYGAKLGEVVAHTNYDLVIADPETGNRMVRSQETNLGDLCADAYLDQMDADLAFVNGGGVRDKILTGDITFGQIVNVHPFGNMACLVEVTGQQILDALEWGYRMVGTGENGGFLQVAGMSCEIDPSIANGCTQNEAGIWNGHTGEYRVKNVKVGGAALDLTKTYKLASHNYMLKSQGDGFGMFGTANVTILRDEVMIDNQVLINYIKDTLDGEVPAAYADPYGQGRIVIVEEEETYDYSVAGDRGFEDDYTFDEDGNLLWTVKLSDLGETLISSLQFNVTWDKTKLELKGYKVEKLSYEDPGGSTEEVGATSSTYDEDGTIQQGTANFAKACTFAYALAASYGAAPAPVLNNVLVTLKFQVKEEVEDGTQMDLTFTEVKCSLVTAAQQTIDADTYTVGAYDGYITAGKMPIDKDALIAEIAKDTGLMAGVVTSKDGKDLANGAKWLTTAQKTANEAALAAAQAIVDKADATQEEVEKALADLIAAFVAPSTAAVNTEALEATIARAEEIKADEAKWAEHSEAWQTRVEAALAAAKAEKDNQAATQNSVDAANTALVNALNKTGESMTVVVFAGIAILALMGLAIVVRRRFN